jgi:hypothetical protein
MLSARCLQKNAETSIYKNAEIGKASAVATAMDRESGNVFKEFDHGFHGFHGCHERLWKAESTAKYPGTRTREDMFMLREMF